MAQPQRQTDVHQDEFCPPNKRYALMDSNKKMDLDNPFTWIYSGRFWHTLKEDGSKYRLSFMLVRKELTLTLDDFRTIFQMPQATDNNHEHFIAAPKTALLTRTSINTDSLSQIHKAYSESLHDCFPEISRRDRDKYHNLEDDMIVKNIFNSGKHKDGVGMKILMFGVDVPTTQLQPIESTHGTHRTTSASRSPDPDVDEGETSAP
ncbi:hypothetical protein Tco_1486399 [Tanacetum coccineum]